MILIVASVLLFLVLAFRRRPHWLWTFSRRRGEQTALSRRAQIARDFIFSSWLALLGVCIQWPKSSETAGEVWLVLLVTYWYLTLRDADRCPEEKATKYDLWSN